MYPGLLVGDVTQLEESLKECIEERESGEGDANVSNSTRGDANASNSTLGDANAGNSTLGDANAAGGGDVNASNEVFEELTVREESLNTILANENMLGNKQRSCGSMPYL